MGFPRQEYWSGLPFPSQGDLLDPEVEPISPALQADSLSTFNLFSNQISMVVISFCNQKHDIYYTRTGVKGKKRHGNKDLIKHLFVEVNLPLLLLYCIAVSSGFTPGTSLRN